MEQLEKERTVFLSLCSPHDRDLLTGRIKMTLQDFERHLLTLLWHWTMRNIPRPA